MTNYPFFLELTKPVWFVSYLVMNTNHFTKFMQNPSFFILNRYTGIYSQMY